MPEYTLYVELAPGSNVLERFATRFSTDEAARQFVIRNFSGITAFLILPSNADEPESVNIATDDFPPGCVMELRLHDWSDRVTY